MDRPQSVTRALVNMVGAAIAFSILNVAVKSLRSEIPTIQLVWVRTLGHLLFVVAAFAPRHGLRLFETQHPVFQLIRSVLLLASTLFYFTAIGFVALATAAAISFMTACPHRRLGGPVLASGSGSGAGWRSASGLLGVLVVARPGADTANLASLLVLGSAAASALYDLLTRRVVGADPPETTVGYAAVVGAVVLGLVVPFAWTPPRRGERPDHAEPRALGRAGPLLDRPRVSVRPGVGVAPFTYLQLVGRGHRRVPRVRRGARRRRLGRGSAHRGERALPRLRGGPGAPRLVGSRHRVVQTWQAAGSGLMLDP